jgi:hypothetical protein
MVYEFIANTMSVILATTAVPKLVNEATAADVTKAPAIAYSTIVSPASSSRKVTSNLFTSFAPLTMDVVNASR